jgi:Tfp pilus assembly protein PilO
MTATATLSSPKELWSSMPGWGIVADLLPPEILAARRVRVLRKRIITALVAVAVLCVAGYGYAFWQAHKASAALESEQAVTAQLQQQQRRYAEVVKIQGSITAVGKQVGTLLANDVDFATLMDSIIRQLPAGVILSQMSVTLDAVTAKSTTGGVAVGGGALDTSGRKHIGSILLTGQASDLAQVAAYVDKLTATPGLVGVFPTSQQVTGKAVQFSLQVVPTDQLLSHRYDPTNTATNTGGK